MDESEYKARVSEFTCHECTENGLARAVFNPTTAEGRSKTTEIDPEKALERLKKTKRAAALAASSTKISDLGQEPVDYPALVKANEHLLTALSWPSLASGYDLRIEDLKEHGLNHPILIRSLDGLGIRLPKSLTAREVVDYLGPDYPLNPMDVRFQSSEPMPLAQFASYLETPENERTRVLNSISVEFSGTPLEDVVERPMVARQLDWDTLGVWGDEDDRPSKVQLYWLCGAKGSYTEWVEKNVSASFSKPSLTNLFQTHSFHIDFSGTTVFYAPIHGSKSFLFLRPTPSILSLYTTWLNSPTQHGTFLPALIPKPTLDEAGGCIKIDITPGECLFIPSGWIHAVLTPEDSSVVGGNFLHILGAGLQIRTSETEELAGMRKKFRMPGGLGWFWRAADYYLRKLRSGASFGTAELKGIKELMNWCRERCEEIRELEQGSERDQEKAEKMRADVPSCVESTKVLWKALKTELKMARREKAEKGSETSAGLGISGVEMDKEPEEELFDLDGAGDWVARKAVEELQKDEESTGELFDLDGTGDWVSKEEDKGSDVFDLDGTGNWMSPPPGEPSPVSVPEPVVAPAPALPKLKLKLNVVAKAAPAPEPEPEPEPVIESPAPPANGLFGSDSDSDSDSSPASIASRPSNAPLKPDSISAPEPDKPIPRKAAVNSKKRIRRASFSSEDDLGKPVESDSYESNQAGSEQPSDDESEDAYRMSDSERPKTKRAFQGMNMSVAPVASKKSATPQVGPPKKRVKTKKPKPALVPVPRPEPKSTVPEAPKVGLIGLQRAKEIEAEEEAARSRAANKKGSVFDRLKTKTSKLGKGDYVRGKK
jgi:hypothetical protein